MAFTFFKFLMVATTLLFVLNTLTGKQWKRGCSGYAHPLHDESYPEKFPESKMGKEMADEDYIAFLDHDFLFANSETLVSSRYTIHATRFPNTSYCEITTPPPKL